MSLRLPEENPDYVSFSDRKSIARINFRDSLVVTIIPFPSPVSLFLISPDLIYIKKLSIAIRHLTHKFWVENPWDPRSTIHREYQRSSNYHRLMDLDSSLSSWSTLLLTPLYENPLCKPFFHWMASKTTIMCFGLSNLQWWERHTTWTFRVQTRVWFVQ
jgi:hypothetical protein